MPTLRLAGLVLCLLILAIPASYGLQRGAQQRGAQQREVEAVPGVVRGHVYSVQTGQPLKRAEVSLRPERGRGGSGASVLTDATGSFEFRDVVPGSYTLRCTRTGYVSASYGQKSAAAEPATITVAPGQELKDLDIQLTRGGVISGTVTDEDGEPLAEVEVSAVVRRYSGRRVSYDPVSQVSTDDRGNYRIYDLSPGRYYVLASFGSAPRPDGSQYSSLYYPAATSIGDAQRVEVNNGNEVAGLDFRLRPAPTFSFAGHVVDSASGQVVSAGRISVAAEEVSGRGRSTTIRPDGSFLIRGLLPGHYQVVIMPGGSVEASVGPVGFASSRGGQSRVRPTFKPFDMPAADVKDYVATVEHPVIVKGRIIADGGQFRSQGARISLAPRTGQAANSSYGQVNEDLGFEVQDVLPGEYSVAVSYRGGQAASIPFYVREVRVSGRDVVERGLAIGPSAPGPVEVVLDFRGGTISGRLLDDKDQPASGASLLLMAGDAQKRNDDRYFRTAGVDQNGQFSMTGLVPGDYLLLPWPDNEAGRLQDPDLFAQVEKYAVRVRVESNGTAAVDFKLPAELIAIARTLQ